MLVNAAGVLTRHVTVGLKVKSSQLFLCLSFSFWFVWFNFAPQNNKESLRTLVLFSRNSPKLLEMEDLAVLEG